MKKNLILIFAIILLAGLAVWVFGDFNQGTFAPYSGFVSDLDAGQIVSVEIYKDKLTYKTSDSDKLYRTDNPDRDGFIYGKRHCEICQEKLLPLQSQRRRLVRFALLRADHPKKTNSSKVLIHFWKSFLFSRNYSISVNRTLCVNNIPALPDSPQGNYWSTQCLYP